MMLQDLRSAVRRLRLNPGFTSSAVAILAVAIAATTAMVSALDAVLLRPLPYDSPDRLVMLWTGTERSGRAGRSAYASIEQWRRQSRSFAGLAVFDPVSATLTQGGDREQIGVLRVSPNLFPLLGIEPLHGRVFSDRDADEREPVALLSQRFWLARFGGSVQTIGGTLDLDGRAVQIVGVLPDAVRAAGFAADVWQPHTLFPDWETQRRASGPGSWFVVGRLRSGVSLEQARAEMDTMATRLEAQRPADGQPRGIGVSRFDLYVTGAEPRRVLWLLTGAAVLLLVLAAVNVAGLTLARGAGRLPEMAIRSALGASPARIARLLLAESLTTAAVAGILGGLLASAAVRVIRTAGPAALPRLQDARLDLPVLAWTVAVTVLAGVLVGLAPAAAMWRFDRRIAWAEGGRGIAGGRATRLRRWLVVTECAAAIVLLAGAGLLVRSWWNVLQVDPGFRSGRVLSMSVATPGSMTDAERASFYDRLLEQVAAVAGVERAGVSSELFVGNVSERTVTAEGSGRAPQPLALRTDEVSPGFFDTIGTPLRRGRPFSSADRPPAARVAIINEAMARQLWPSRDPLGRRFTLDPPGPGAVWLTVVGVVADMRRQGPEIAPVPQVFEALSQNPSRRAILFVAGAIDDPLRLAGPVRAAVRRVDARVVTYNITTVDERLGALLAQRRWQTALLTGFAAAALLLATIGLYGLVQYSVAARTHEIGIRMALGARRGDVFGMVVREGLLLGLAGLALGLPGAFWLSRAASGLLFGVTATDPATFAAVAALAVSVTLAASCLPASRATRVSPLEALRHRPV